MKALKNTVMIVLVLLGLFVLISCKNDKNEGITYLGRFMDKILRVQNRRVKTGAAHALEVTWRCRNLCDGTQERLHRHVLRSTSGRIFGGIYKVSYQILSRFTVNLIRTRKKFFRKKVSKYHLLGEKRCKRLIHNNIQE